MSASPGELSQILENIQLIEYKTLKDILKFFIALLALTNLLLFFTTIIHRLYVDLRDYRYRRSYERYEYEFEAYSMGRGVVTNPRNSIEFEALSDFCVFLIRKEGAIVSDCVRRVVSGLGLVDYLWKQTRSLFLNTRVTAFERLGYLRAKEIKDILEKLIKEERREWVAGRYCFAYSFVVDEMRQLSFLISKLSEFEEISFKFIELIWSNILENFRAKRDELREFVLDELLGFRKKWYVLRSLVEAVGFEGEKEFTPLIREIYDRSKGDVLMRLSCLRALGLLGYEDYCDLFLSNVDHPDWRIRAVVCKFAYLCPFNTVVESVKGRLSDHNYYVRINAGRALARFGMQAVDVLKEIMKSEDKFARDTAKYLLEEIELKHA